jgi:carbon monoxide dehydrogenase subunit G
MARVEGTETLELPRSEVWRLLNDPDALGASIPGCRGFERDGEAEHRYRTAIAVAVGAVKGVYEGTVSYQDVSEPERCTIVVSGRGDKGTIDGEGAITLEAADQRTEVGYRGTFKLTGPVAGVGQRMAPGISRKMIVETLRNLEQRGAGEAEGDRASGGGAEEDAPAEERPSAEPFRPFSLSPGVTFAAGCALGLVLGVLIAEVL